MLNLPKKTLVLIGALATVTILLLAMAVWLSGKKPTATPSLPLGASPTPTIPKTATLAFSPALVNLVTTPSNTVTVDIIAGSASQAITGVQTEITYDPKVITNVKLLPANPANALFKAGSLTLFNTNDPVKGMISYAVAINPSGKGILGSGSIGQLTFTVTKGVTPATTISFGGNTIVTSEGIQGSILNTSTPLTIQLQ